MNIITFGEIVRNTVVDKLNKAFIATQILSFSKCFPHSEFDIENLSSQYQIAIREFFSGTSKCMGTVAE